MGIFKFWIGNVPNLDHPWLDIDDTAILTHRVTPSSVALPATWKARRCVAKHLNIRWPLAAIGSLE
jgi:hypothetical protein